MSFLILVRHGQSAWNLEKKFTGWVDVDLTEKGKLEAEKAGRLIKQKNINIDYYYSSLQKRATNTLKIIQDVLGHKKDPVKTWCLNERHCGALTGLNKIELSKKIGESKVHDLRRSWDTKPDPLSKESPYHPLNIKTYENLPKEILPDTESLKDTFERVQEYFKREIEEKIINNNILISAHGNSIRALCKHLLKLDNNQIAYLEIPTGNPLILELNDKFEVKNCEYLDKERSKDLLVF